MINYNPITTEQINDSFQIRQGLYRSWLGESIGSPSSKPAKSIFDNNGWLLFFWLLTSAGCFILGYLISKEELSNEVDEGTRKDGLEIEETIASENNPQ